MQADAQDHVLSQADALTKKEKKMQTVPTKIIARRPTHRYWLQRRRLCQNLCLQLAGNFLYLFASVIMYPCKTKEC